MQGYTSRDVARMLDLSVQQVRSYAKAGALQPGRGPRGEYRFSFQDLVALRAAKALVAKSMPAVRVRRVIALIRDRLPVDRPLSGVQIRVDGDEIVVSDGANVWCPETGQTLLNFEMHDPTVFAGAVARHTRSGANEPGDDDRPLSRDLDAEDWFGLGSDLESAAPDHAREAYRRTLELKPMHIEARVNLGRVLHEQGLVGAAEEHYRIALRLDPNNATAWFNLGVSLEDLGRDSEAAETYRAAIDNDPSCADAYYNLARLLEKTGERAAALRYLQTYKKLTDDL